MPSPDPREIAKRLTKAQKRALLWLPKDNNPRLKASWMGDCPRWPVLMALVHLGLAMRWQSDGLRLTAWSLSPALGNEVRAVLEGGSDG
ncbi:hypothetical protein HMPREF9946_02184 [Acetobacteraceae bacterium AT-5844]|nr:hypothetical protein HMPREF9946_02184 [Acetobacteraceae bacterium AT-5844]